MYFLDYEQSGFNTYVSKFVKKSEDNEREDESVGD